MTGLDFSPATGGQGEGLRGIRADHGRGARTAPDANTRLLCDAKSLAFCGLASEGRRTDGPLPLAGARVPRAACRRCAAMLCSDSSLAVMGMQPAGFRLSAVPDPRTSPWQHRAGNLGSSRPGTSAQEARAASCPVAPARLFGVRLKPPAARSPVNGAPPRSAGGGGDDFRTSYPA